MYNKTVDIKTEDTVILDVPEFLYSVSFALDAVEEETIGSICNHSKRVALLSMILGREIGFSNEQCVDIAAYSILHDNGLTEYLSLGHENAENASFEETPSNIKFHCVVGENNIKYFPFFKNEENVIKYHHENIDGSGLFGMVGSEIPIMAKIIRIIDNIDVLFKFSTMRIENLNLVYEHLNKNSGVLYDEFLVKSLLKVLCPEVIIAMKDENIVKSLKIATPEYKINVTFSELEEISAVFARIIDFKSPFTLKHSTGIAEKTEIISKHLGFDAQEVQKLKVAALLHDIGKLAVPSELLEKPAKLTPDEYNTIKNHVVYTWNILNSVTGFNKIAFWAASHHERLDGSGYFRGINAQQLDMPSRILGCIDVYQALVENRPYRRGMNHDEAMKILFSEASKGKLDNYIVEQINNVFKNQ